MTANDPPYLISIAMRPSFVAGIDVLLFVLLIIAIIEHYIGAESFYYNSALKN